MEQDSKVRFVESLLDFTFLFIPIIQIEFVILPIWKYSSWLVFFVKKRKFLIINDIVEIRHQQNVSNTLEAIACRHVYKCAYASRLYLALKPKYDATSVPVLPSPITVKQPRLQVSRPVAKSVFCLSQTCLVQSWEVEYQDSLICCVLHKTRTFLGFL